jgi:hypothetical protein
MSEPSKLVEWNFRTLGVFLGNLVAAAWILGGAGFYFLRFGSIVYTENREFFDAWLK